MPPRRTSKAFSRPMAAASMSAASRDRGTPSVGSEAMKAMATIPYTEPTERSISRERMTIVCPIANSPRMAAYRVMLIMVKNWNQLSGSPAPNTGGGGWWGAGRGGGGPQGRGGGGSSACPRRLSELPGHLLVVFGAEHI